MSSPLVDVSDPSLRHSGRLLRDPAKVSQRMSSLRSHTESLALHASRRTCKGSKGIELPRLYLYVYKDMANAAELDVQYQHVSLLTPEPAKSLEHANMTDIRTLEDIIPPHGVRTVLLYKYLLQAELPVPRPDNNSPNWHEMRVPATGSSVIMTAAK